MKKVTIPQIISRKGQDKIVVVTAYSARMAELIDPHVDIILVGDSLGMTLHGLPSTLMVTLEMMILAGQAVNRGRKKSLLVVDMPFSTYESSKEKAYENAAKLLSQTGCEAVKLEGGEVMEETITYLTARNIPVMAHVGLQPQKVHHYGGYGARGRTDDERATLLKDILATQRAGAFSVVIEGTDTSLAKEMTEAVKIPTIGIGASPICDGQVLVSDDLLGLTEKCAKFVKKYDNLSEHITKAIEAFADEVKKGIFPAENHLYSFSKEK